MHAHSLDPWRHEHVFLGQDHARNERRSWAVVALCGAMMAAEIVGGLLWGSMALIADGLHMSTNAGALDLAAFSSALVLAMIALLIGYESIGRLIHPVPIAFDEAIPLAAVGLLVNLLSALLLHESRGEDALAPHQHHGDGHRHHDRHHHQHADHNLRAAYVHVMADAAVSMLVLIGLSVGRLLGWLWLDPVMGIVGMLVIANWSWNLIHASGAVLLDMKTGDGIATEIKHRLEAEREDRVSDLHVWRVG